MSPTTIAVTNHDLSPVKSPYRYDANCVFRYDDKKVRNTYCESEAFLDFLRPHVITWQLAAIQWNQDSDNSLTYEEHAILCPDLEIHLLDPDNDT